MTEQLSNRVLTTPIRPHITRHPGSTSLTLFQLTDLLAVSPLSQTSFRLRALALLIPLPGMLFLQADSWVTNSHNFPQIAFSQQTHPRSTDSSLPTPPWPPSPIPPSLIYSFNVPKHISTYHSKYLSIHCLVVFCLFPLLHVKLYADGCFSLFCSSNSARSIKEHILKGRKIKLFHNIVSLFISNSTCPSYGIAQGTIFSYLVMNHNGKEFEKVCVYMYNWITLPYSRN